MYYIFSHQFNGNVFLFSHIYLVIYLPFISNSFKTQSISVPTIIKKAEVNDNLCKIHARKRHIQLSSVNSLPSLHVHSAKLYAFAFLLPVFAFYDIASCSYPFIVF